MDADADLTPDVETLLPHELEAGREYHVIFTHVGGFHRYAVGDVVRVVDMSGGVPRVAYAGRANRSDAVGERLRESQVVRALRSALTATGLGLVNVACRTEVTPGEGAPHYVFAVAPESPWQEAEAARFTELLDDALRRESADYGRARSTRSLGAPALRLLDRDAFQRDWHASVATGIRPTQVKDRLFRQDAALWCRLTGRA
ncbi:hypothetical protein [Streptomyces sp. H34-S4]|uniref:hypothetical protein n=1 Tax=Streptomyces sp. H34-S4 TaxID=2996463 RepID=UPI003B63E1D3